MKNISEYDQRQLKLMLQSLDSFKNNLIDLNSLIGTLEFLLIALEVEEKDWNKNFFEEVGNLETINAIEIINENEVGCDELDPIEKESSINESTLILKTLIENRLNQ